MKKEYDYKFTTHALKRSQQRAIRNWVINFILVNADKNKHAGRGCMSRFVTRKKLNLMINKKTIKPSDAQLVEGVVIIERDCQIQTVFHKKLRMKNQ